MLKVSGANRANDWVKRQCGKCRYECICKKINITEKGIVGSIDATSLKGLIR